MHFSVLSGSMIMAIHQVPLLLNGMMTCYEWFYSANQDGSYNGARVNPLSDIPLVLGGASENIPFDYWLVDEISDRLANGNSVPSTLRDKNYSELLSGTSWSRYTNGWFNCLLNARNNYTEVINGTTYSINSVVTDNAGNDVGPHLRDIYNSYNYFGWYSEATDLNQVLNPASATLCRRAHLSDHIIPGVVRSGP